MKNKLIRLRPAVADDLAALHALDGECFPPGIAYSLGEMRHFLSRRKAVCLVAEDDGQLAGFAIAEPPGRFGKAAHVTTIDVARRGRRKGLGTLLMDAIESTMAAQGVRLLRLEVAVNNCDAQAFYQGRGFRAVGTIRGYYMGTLDALLMEKVLKPK